MLLKSAWLALLVLVDVPLAYLYTLALAAIRTPSLSTKGQPRHRFVIAIAAHDEEVVIGRTVRNLLQQDYPSDLFTIHVVADHCSDSTSSIAGAAGAIVHERSESPAGSKGAALRWLLARILGESCQAPRPPVDAVVIFDADTRVAPDFLRVIDMRLDAGDLVVQGQHRISNPQDGWFPALTWAMFIIDNRFQNLGRSNLGLSAKNMGDSICFRADVLRRLGWGEGLTEDYAFRQELLLQGIKIRYEPRAIGYGEAAQNWQTAKAQRARWLRGARDASRRYARQLLAQAVRKRDLPLLDGALQANLPAYSTLTIVAGVAWLAQVLVILARPSRATPASLALIRLWSVSGAALFVYPLLGLALERAPLKAYLVILSGPVFIAWRTWLTLTLRLKNQRVAWVRTPRRATPAESASSRL